MQGFDKIDSVNAIISDFRLTTTDNTVLTRVSDIWDSFADKANVYPRLQDLYTRRAVADNYLLGVWDRTDWEQAGAKESGDQFDHLQALRANYHAEIVRLEKRATANRGGAVGMIAATAPVMVGTNCLDPNARAYGGDILTRTRNGRAF